MIEDYEKVIQRINENKRLKKEKYLNDSRERLSKLMERKMRTIFIGSLESFEDFFGFLWGQNKSPESMTDEERREKLTEEEYKFYNFWLAARNDILNKGNNQIRSMRNELKHNTVHWDRYNTTFKVINEEEKNEGNI